MGASIHRRAGRYHLSTGVVGRGRISARDQDVGSARRLREQVYTDLPSGHPLRSWKTTGSFIAPDGRRLPNSSFERVSRHLVNERWEVASLSETALAPGQWIWTREPQGCEPIEVSFDVLAQEVCVGVSTVLSR